MFVRHSDRGDQNVPDDYPFQRAARGPARRRRRGSGRRGAIYARYSSRFQHSIEDQIRECRKWAEANGIDVLDYLVFTDEKTSGKKNRRAGFAALTQAIVEHRVDVVIVFNTSRLFRKTYQSLKFVEEEVCDRRMRCVFVKSNIDTADAENWRKLLHLHSLVDELTITLQAAHIRAAHEGQLRMGVVFGTLTYGFRGEPIEGQQTKLGKPARRLAVDAEAAKWVERIFAWFVRDEMSIPDIVRTLNAAPDAPLPDGARLGRWTYQIVRRILDNPRYRGRWVYGATEVVWQNKADYGRQFAREQPLAEIDLPHLRVIDEQTWLAAQRRLADFAARAGRKPKNGGPADYPRLLNRLCYCEKHTDQQLWVGGTNGKYLFCPRCRTDPQRALVSQLPRVPATRLLLVTLARAIRADAELAGRVAESCGRQVADLQRSDPGVLAEKRKEEERLTQQIKRVLTAPCETEQDEAENRATLADLRRQRAIVQAEVCRLEEAASRPMRLPTVEEVRRIQERLADVLVEAVGSSDPRKMAAARQIVEALTGGRIVVSQQGEAAAKRAWLRGTFTLHLLQPALAELGASATWETADSGVEMRVDFRKPAPAEVLADDAKALLDQGLLVTEVAAELSRRHERKIGRSMATKALAYWFMFHGLAVPDLRSRRKTLAHKATTPALYEQIADRVLAGIQAGTLYGEVADELGVDRNTVTATVRFLRETRGISIPDGRTRRKALGRKSRPGLATKVP